MNKPYQRAVLGGTFDRFHPGHKLLLKTAAHVARTAFVGVVSEELGKTLFQSKFLAEKIEPYAIREASVLSYLKEIDAQLDVGPLLDPWGPSITDPTADVIVVSRETRGSADRINAMRKEKGLQILDIVTIPWIKNEEGNIISSSLKRQSESS